MILALVGNTHLRTAITRNLVTFPGHIRPFMKRGGGDLQERIVQLYFVRGWSARNICERYGIGKAMVHKLLAEWRVRAIESGYMQESEPGCLSALEPELNSAAMTEVRERVTTESAIPKPAQTIFADPLPGSLPAAHRAAAMSVARSA